MHRSIPVGSSSTCAPGAGSSRGRSDFALAAPPVSRPIIREQPANHRGDRSPVAVATGSPHTIEHAPAPDASTPEICPFSERDGPIVIAPHCEPVRKAKSVVRLMLPPARIFSAECWPCRGLLFLSAIIASCRSPRRRRETDTAGPRLAPRPHGPPSSRLLIREALLHLPSCREPSGAPSLR